MQGPEVERKSRSQLPECDRCRGFVWKVLGNMRGEGSLSFQEEGILYLEVLLMNKEKCHSTI